MVVLALIGAVICLARWSSRNKAWRLASLPALVGLLLTALQQLPGEAFVGYTAAFLTPVMVRSVRKDDVHEPGSHLNMLVIAVFVIASCWSLFSFYEPPRGLIEIRCGSPARWSTAE